MDQSSVDLKISKADGSVGTMNTTSTVGSPTCFLCASNGRLLYRHLNDRHGRGTGAWDLRVCSGCGLLWLDPLPSDEDLEAAYSEYYTHVHENRKEGLLRRLLSRVRAGHLARRFGYSEEASRSDRLLGCLAYLHPGQLEVMSASAMYLPAGQRGRLLEVGFGNGALLAEMRRLGWSVAGVDTDRRAVEIAHNRYGLDVRCGTVGGQEFPSDAFSAVFMSHVIEHVRDPIETLQECLRVLKPGGSIVILTPNANSLGHRFFKSSYLHLDPPRHLHLFSRSTLATLASRSGMRLARVETTSRGANMMYIASRLIARRDRYSWTTDIPWSGKVAGHVYQYLEWLVGRFDEDAGDELLLIGMK